MLLPYLLKLNKLYNYNYYPLYSKIVFCDAPPPFNLVQNLQNDRQPLEHQYVTSSVAEFVSLCVSSSCILYFQT